MERLSESAIESVMSALPFEEAQVIKRNSREDSSVSREADLQNKEDTKFFSVYIEDGSVNTFLKENIQENLHCHVNESEKSTNFCSEYYLQNEKMEVEIIDSYDHNEPMHIKTEESESENESGNENVKINGNIDQEETSEQGPASNLNNSIFPDDFEYIILENNSGVSRYVLRAALKDGADALSWVRAFESCSSTRWIVKRGCNFKQKGTEVHVIEEDNQWAVLLVTPVMNRFQNYDTAKEVVLIDSSSNCDSTSVTVTVLFAVTKAGAIPVGVIIHKNESEDSYVLAFSALQSKYSKFFGGKDTPKIFITDDSVAKKNALRTCWPGSNQFLCQYHVAQAEWRWLQSRKCGISIERKRSLMTMFQKIMYANTDEKLHEAMSELNECPEKNYVSHVKSFLNHQEEWITFFRIDKLINDYNMINYSAATVKVIMNVLLGRVRAFNVIALMHYCSAVFEEYISQKIYLSVMSDKAEEEKMYNNLVEQMSDDILPQVKKIDEYSYSVPSVTDRNVSYTVDIQVGTCNCPNSRSGRFCKHQALIHKHFGGLLPKSPVMSTNDRYVLAQLALGTQCPDRNSFLDIMWTGDESLSCGDLTNLQETEDSSVSTVNEKVRKLDDEIEEKRKKL